MLCIKWYRCKVHDPRLSEFYSFLKANMLKLNGAETVMYVCRQNEQERGSGEEFVVMSAVVQKSDGWTNKTSPIWWKLSCLHISLPPCLCVSLSFCIFKKRILILLAYFPKNKKNALTLETAPSLHSRHARKLPQVVVWLEEGRWELNIKKRGRERGKCLTREIFPNTTAYFCLKDLLSSLTLTVMLL